MMVLFHLEAHFLHHRDHLGPEVGAGIDRGDREITALDARAVADVAIVEVGRGVIGAFLAIDAKEGVVHIGGEAHVVEDEELRLRPHVDGIADAGGLQVVLGPHGHRSGVAAIKLAGSRVDDVAKNDEMVLRGKGVHDHGRKVRLQDHVGLVNRLPAFDR
jgi:hypothetical protein